MRNIYILLGWLLLTNQLASQPLVQENKVWNVIECLNFGGCVTESLKLNGDTIIDDIAYKKLYSTFDTTLNGWVLLGAMREAEREIFLHNFENEALFYDFNLSVADTFRTSLNLPPGCQLELIVSSIDTLTIENGEQRQRYTFNNGEQWIKGIGSLYGLTYVGVYQCIIDQFYDLSCVHLDDELIFRSPDFEHCYVKTVGLPNVNTDRVVSVYPNPSTGIFRINFPEQPATNTRIIVSGLSGNIIFQGLYGSEEITIDLSEYANGIYFVRLFSGNKTDVKKLVKF